MQKKSICKQSKRKFTAFTLAEMMVVLLIMSIIMAAMAPVMTTRNKTDYSSPWKYSANLSDAYFGLGNAQHTLIGLSTTPATDTDSKLIINKGDSDTVFKHITFRDSQNGDSLGFLSFGNSNSIMLGDSIFNNDPDKYNDPDNNVVIGNTIINDADNQVGNNNVLIGSRITNNDNNNANIENSVAIGSNNQIHNTAVGIGYFAQANNIGAISIGRNSRANAEESIAIGAQKPSVGGANSILGPSASQNYSIAIGTGANVTVVDGVAAENSIAIGKQAEVGAVSNSISMGTNTQTTQPNSVAIGSNSEAHISGSVSIGHNNQAGHNHIGVDISDTANIAIGENVNIENLNTIGIGKNLNAIGNNHIAIGSNITIKGKNNIAIGNNACHGVSGENKVCIGNNSNGYSTFNNDSDTIERIFIGGPSTFPESNGGPVLEVHNNGPQSAVVVNGDLLVKGKIKTNLRSVIGTDQVYKLDGVIQDEQHGNMLSVTLDSFGTYSDRRLKNVGKPSEAGLEQIRKLKVFNYTFKKDKNNTPRVGVIAQDLKKVFPNAVKKAADGFLTIRLEDMFYAMINAIKELDFKYQAQEKRINDLENRINKLEAKIDKLSK